jgi:hypothetical protein
VLIAFECALIVGKGHPSRVPASDSSSGAISSQTGGSADGAISRDVLCANQTRDLDQALSNLKGAVPAAPGTTYDPRAPEIQNVANAYVQALNAHTSCMGWRTFCTSPPIPNSDLGNGMQAKVDLGIWEYQGRLDSPSSCRYGANGTTMSIKGTGGQEMAQVLNGMWMVHGCSADGDVRLILEGPNKQIAKKDSESGNRSAVIIDGPGPIAEPHHMSKVLVGDSRSGYQNDLGFSTEPAADGHGARLKFRWSNGDWVKIDADSGKFVATSLPDLVRYECGRSFSQLTPQSAHRF